LGLDGFVQFATVFAIFILVLVITYFTTRFVGGYAKNRIASGNIEIIDSMKVAPSKYIAIVRTAAKYIAVGIGKDEITFLCEIPEESLVERRSPAVSGSDFRELMEKAKARIGKK
jgi:flagellar protein FliO/FliZ